MILLRPVARLLAMLLLVALSLAGLCAAVACIGSGTSSPSFPWLAEQLRLASLRDSVGRFLAALEHSGGTAVLSALCGLAAMLVGLGLLFAILVPGRDRRVVLATASGDGTIEARRGPLGQAARALSQQARGVTASKVHVRPGRRSGGRLSVRADRPRTIEASAVKQAVEQQLKPLTEPFKLKARVQPRLGRRGSRVQ
jgi:hypothetical protein